jgi:hypothetical protein
MHIYIIQLLEKVYKSEAKNVTLPVYKNHV